MDWKNLNTEELQEAYLLHGKNFPQFLGISYPQSRRIIKENGLLEPTEYVRKMSWDEVLIWLRTLGTWEKVAEHFSVSDSFMRSLYPKSYERGEFKFRFAEDKENKNFIEEIKRLGSISLFSRVYKTPESEVRKYAKDKKIEISSYISYEGTGFENAKGRKAELFYKDYRGSYILKDMNEDEGSQAEYDFQDSVYGRVDVKSSQRYEYKARTRIKSPHFWKFSVSGLTADSVAFVAMDEKYDKVIGICIVDAKWIKEDSTTLTINEVVFKLAQGRAFLTKDEFEEYILKGNIDRLLPKTLRG